MAELTTLARPYAKASFEFALAEKNLQEWSNFLRDGAFVVNAKKVAGQLDSPVLKSKQKSELVAKLLGDKLTQSQKNLLQLLAENKRLTLLDEISQLFELFKASYEKAIDVDITSAYEMSDAQLALLTKALEKNLQRKVEITSAVDKDLIGGVFVKAGDTVIDASVRGRLDRLEEALGA